MPKWPRLDVAIRHRIGSLSLNVQLQLTKPWTVLFAPSGAGKTTILRTIAGLMHAEEERIVWTGAASSGKDRTSVVLSDTTKRRFMPAHERLFPMVMQQSALFPHLTVIKNVRYGLPIGTKHLDNDSSFQSLLKVCRVEGLADKMPAQLSGGERQRVALARALAANGRGVLLDEPFAGIDGSLKEKLMRDLKAWLGTRGAPVLHVTHEVGEVFAVADEVILLRDGRVVAQGPPETVLREERERLLGWLEP